MLISAEPAHDATGKAVPTTISVSGNIITLTVHYKQPGVSYPVMSGASFEVGYEWKEAILPSPPASAEDPEVDDGPWETYNPAQQTNPLTRLPMSVRRPNLVEFSDDAPTVIGGQQKHHRPHAKYFSRSNEDNWWIELYGWFTTNNTSAWRDEGSGYKCSSDSNPVIYHNVRKVKWAGESPIYQGKGKHMLLWCTADIIFLYPEGESNTRWKVSLLMWPDGYWRPEIHEVEECFTANGHQYCGPVLT